MSHNKLLNVIFDLNIYINVSLRFMSLAKNIVGCYGKNLVGGGVLKF